MEIVVVRIGQLASFRTIDGQRGLKPSRYGIRQVGNQLPRADHYDQVIEIDKGSSSGIEVGMPVVNQAGLVGKVTRVLTNTGAEGGDTITALSRALLFYAAQARPGSKATDLLRERFRLEELIPDRDALLRARGAVTGRDASLFHSIGEAVREELGQVKDTLDMELRTGRVDAEQREASRTSLQQLADTLEMLNLPVPAKAVEELLPALADSSAGINMDLDSPLLALAQKLLEVESILATHIQLLGEPVEESDQRGFLGLPPHEQRQVFSTMLDECVTTLNGVQDAIRERLEGKQDTDFSTGLLQIAAPPTGDRPQGEGEEEHGQDHRPHEQSDDAREDHPADGAQQNHQHGDIETSAQEKRFEEGVARTDDHAPDREQYGRNGVGN